MEEVKVKNVNDNEVSFDITEHNVNPEIDYEKVISELKNNIDTEHNNYLRALADSENIRKTFAKKQADLYAYQYEPIMKDMLDVFDDIDRGLAADAFSEGGQLIMQKLRNIFEKYGLEPILTESGEAFNSDDMEAVSTLAIGDEMVNKVIDTTQMGYTYNGKIIRYPKVVVGA